MRDIRTLDLNLLRAFGALLDERNVTRAASRLALTQPAVSGMLTRLRQSFDDPLFVRTTRGIVPTARALELAGPLKRVLRDIEALLQPPAFEPATAGFTARIAATDYAVRVIVVPLLAALRTRAPGIRLLVRPIDNDRVARQLERGDLDLALTTPETTAPDLHARRLFDETYVCALRADHPALAGCAFDLDRFCALDHALVSFGGDFSGVTDAALASLGRSRRVTLSVASFLVLLDVLRTTDLVGVMPRRLVTGQESLAMREPPLDLPGFTKLAAWHERSHRDPGLAWLRGVLFDICGNVG